MSIRKQLAMFQIGSREIRASKPGYLVDVFRRRFSRALNLEEHWPGGWCPKPEVVCLIPTQRCNLTCKMCFQRDESGRLRLETNKQDLSPRQWESIIDRIADFAPATLWMGGEILVYPGIVDLLAYTKAKGLQITALTNGFYLADVAEKLVEIGVDKLCVSIDGLEQSHNTLRRNRQSFRRAVEGIKAVLATRKARNSPVPIVNLNHVITQQNYLDLTEFVSFAEDLGIDIVEFLGLTYLSSSEAEQHNHILKKEFGIVAEKLDVLYNGATSEIDASLLQQRIHSLRQNTTTKPILRFYPEGLETRIEMHYGKQDSNALSRQRCVGVWRRMVILPNGDVAVCYNQPELIMGNVLDQELPSIWNSEQFRQFRQRIRQQLLPGCARCNWLEYR